MSPTVVPRRKSKRPVRLDPFLSHASARLSPFFLVSFQVFQSPASFFPGLLPSIFWFHSVWELLSFVTVVMCS